MFGEKEDGRRGGKVARPRGRTWEQGLVGLGRVMGRDGACLPVEKIPGVGWGGGLWRAGWEGGQDGKENTSEEGGSPCPG